MPLSGMRRYSLSRFVCNRGEGPHQETTLLRSDSRLPNPQKHRKISRAEASQSTVFSFCKLGEDNQILYSDANL